MDPQLSQIMMAAAADATGQAIPQTDAPDQDDLFGMNPADDKSHIDRETPEPDEARRALVKKWNEKVTRSKKHWKGKAFDQMRSDMKFAGGEQWPSKDAKVFGENEAERYVANITLRHIAQRTANLYGKNPKITARRRARILNTVWDGTHQSLQQAMQAMMQASAIAGGNMMMAAAIAPDAAGIIADAQNVMQQEQQLDRIGKTLEVMFNWNIEEQVLPFKQQMKAMVRRALTTGVGYVKIGFQRAMELDPEVQREIADFSERLATVERLGADIQDGEIAPDAAEAEQLRLAIQALAPNEQIIVREGLTFDWPDSWSIIPDEDCKSLHGFIGSSWVAQEYLLSADKIEEIYKVDVSKSGTAYSADKSLDSEINRHMSGGADSGAETSSKFCVWEIYNRADGLVYTVCDGYSDFLEEPEEPDTKIERFWPWFAFTTNELYLEDNPYPPSDVFLIRHPQLEFNRARQGLREQRRANRPKWATAAGMLDDGDKDKLKDHPANALLELNALQPGQKIEDVLQPVRNPPIDPALYDVGSSFDDVLRVAGSQEANLGPTSGATATESSIAESSRVAAVGSTVDDLDELLTSLARTGGQILMANVTQDTAVKIVGPGAIWPQMTMQEIQNEIYLEVQAGSSGRPNQAQEVQNASQLMPILMQIPGISPEWMARELIRRMDDRIDLTDAFASGMPSIMAMNRMSQMAPGGPGGDPNQQGDQGANNERTDPKQSNVGARPPQAPPGQGTGPGAS